MKTHYFSQVIVGRVSHTLCGIRAKLDQERNTAIKDDSFRIQVTRDYTKVDCGRCLRSIA